MLSYAIVLFLFSRAEHDVDLQMANQDDARLLVEASVACHSADFAPELQRGIEDPNVLSCGILTGLSLQMQAHSQVGHQLAVCFLLPGLYQVYACDVRAQTEPRESLANGLANGHAPTSFRFSMRPLYVLVL